MGQYYYVVNLDKKQFLHPHKLGDGLKLMEFGASGCGTMLGLALLLADGNGRGGGDWRGGEDADGLIGSWAGDRIVITGDYADEGRFVPSDAASHNLYTFADEHFDDISLAVRKLLDQDPGPQYVRQRWDSQPAPENE